MQKRRVGFNLIWRFAGAYAAKIKLKRKGQYPASNQHNGQMFALPSEVSITGLQAGTILRTCYKNGATKSQLESVRKTLAYAFQLTTGFEGNYDEVEIAKSSFDPREYGQPTRKVMPVRIIPPDRLADAFLKEWSPDCGMSMPEWCVGGNIVWDWCLNGGRSGIDLQKLKKSNTHHVSAAEGWMKTKFVGGRSKLQRKKGVREWWGYRLCLCPKGKHIGPPIEFWKTLDGRGNPTGGTPYCTTCPLNMVDFVFRLLPQGQKRLYPRWLVKSGKFSVEDVGKTELIPLANRWLKLQGANPDDVGYCSNSGRKALAQVCSATNTPYEESFETHGDLPKTWVKYYQPDMKPTVWQRPYRRTQSKNHDTCLKLHRRFALYIGRGRPNHEPVELSRTDALLALLARSSGLDREVAQILLKT